MVIDITCPVNSTYKFVGLLSASGLECERFVVEIVVEILFLRPILFDVFKWVDKLEKVLQRVNNHRLVVRKGDRQMGNTYLNRRLNFECIWLSLVLLDLTGDFGHFAFLVEIDQLATNIFVVIHVGVLRQGVRR